MEIAKLCYEGCTVEVVAEDKGEKVLDMVIRIFDPKGKELVNERCELFGHSLLESRLIRMLSESKREDLREQKLIDRAIRRKYWPGREVKSAMVHHPYLKAA